MRLKILMALAILVPAVSRPAFCSNFTIFENGVRASGMGGAFAAIADDGSALFYNPAGIAFQKGLRLEMDSLGVVGLFRFHPSDTPAGTIVPEKGYNLSVSPHLIPVASLYLTKDLSSRVTFGFGMFAPFGLAANATNFNDSDPKNTKYVGRFAGTRGKLESFWMQPTISFLLTPETSIAFGVAYVHTHLLLEQSILNPLDDGQVFGEQLAGLIFPDQDPEQAGRAIARLLPEGRSRIAGTSNSPGFNFGYLYRNEKSKSSFGFSWRSAVTHHLTGMASFAFTTGYPLEEFIGKETIPDLFPRQKVKGSFTTPATYAFGFANSALWDSTIAVDVVLQDYKRFNDVPLNFTKTVDTATPAELRLNFGMETSWAIRTGIEKHIGEHLTVRGGYSFDHSPVLDRSVGPTFPDSSRNSFSGGVSWMRKNAEVSLFYQATNFVDRTTNVEANDKVFTNGEYLNFAHLFGLGMRIHLGESMNPFGR